MAEAARKASNVELVERVSFGAVQDLFDRALAFVNTSEAEGFPNTFIQAGLAKTPIVSLRVDPAGAVSRGGGGYVCGDSEAELARAVGLLLADPEERRRRGNAAFRYVKENHDLAKVAEEFKGIVRSLASTAPRARRRPAC
ncbi:MAG: glycosyltransferase family 4 protein [Planctomycetes bacterium]|nr:glycosyltransferase family 4 protein [Planctomycetota bacterium]